MKTLKIMCLSFLIVWGIYGICFGAEEHAESDVIEEIFSSYTGTIAASDKNFVLIKITDKEKYSMILIRDKQGFVIDGDIVEGQLFRLASMIVVDDKTQSSKFSGTVKRASRSRDEIYRAWEYRYE